MPKSPYAPCIPTRGTKVPSHSDWIHEVKQDGFRLIVLRDGDRIRLFTRNGYDWAKLPADGRGCPAYPNQAIRP
jgi:bifunctional non-homologous end joining protein LigD